MPAAGKAKFTRAKTGCLTCGKRKHKCDEVNPFCNRCSYSSRPCVYPEIPQSSTPSDAAPTAASATPIPASGLGLGDDWSLDDIFASTGLLADPAWNLAPQDNLAIIFPNDDERELMRHFICFGTVNLCAIPQPDKPIRFFDLACCLQHPRGTSFQSDAMLLSLLSIAAVHRSSLFTNLKEGRIISPIRGRWGTPDLPIMPPSVASIEQLKCTAARLSSAAFELSRTALAFPTSIDAISIVDLNVVLSSMICVIVAQVMIGGSTWKRALSAALEVVRLSGGPEAYHTRAKATDGVVGARARTLLEHLEVVDVLHSMGTGSRPMLLGEDTAAWWLECALADESDEFHHIFGADREVLELANRINLLAHEHRQGRSPADTYQTLQNIDVELDVWEACTQSITAPTRIQLGNSIIVHTLRIITRVDVSGLPHSVVQMQAAALAVLNQVKQSRGLWVVNLLLPTIIAGSMMFDSTGRGLARRAVESLRLTVSYSYDVDQALGILDKLYKQRDAGDSDPSWRPLMADILLL